MFLVLLLLFPLRLCCAPSVEAHNLSPVKTILETAGVNDLVVFDVDCTLCIPVDMALRPIGKVFFLKQFAEYSKTMHDEQVRLLLSKILLQRSIAPVDEEMPALVRSLQARNIKTIALTTLFTGRFGQIQNVEKWRVGELKKLGYDFSPSFPNYHYIVFGDIAKPSSLPIFKDGVLFAARHTKADMLQAFLRRVKWTPDRIIYIDDTQEDLEAVSPAMQQENIACVCIHYRAHEKLVGTLNETVALKQFEHLKRHETWLSDAELND